MSSSPRKIGVWRFSNVKALGLHLINVKGYLPAPNIETQQTVVFGNFGSQRCHYLWASFPFFFFISVSGFSQVDSNWKSIWRNPHTVSGERTSSEIHFTKSTTISRIFFYTGPPLNSTEKHVFPFFENSPGKFIEFDEFYFLGTFSLVDFWWILIFVDTESNPHKVRIHRKLRWITESTER